MNIRYEVFAYEFVIRRSHLLVINIYLQVEVLPVYRNIVTAVGEIESGFKTRRVNITQLDEKVLVAPSS